MESSSCCNSVVGHQIATIFCTCHDSTAVVPCTKFCSDHSIRLEINESETKFPSNLKCDGKTVSDFLCFILYQVSWVQSKSNIWVLGPDLYWSNSSLGPFSPMFVSHHYSNSTERLVLSHLISNLVITKNYADNTIAVLLQHVWTW